MILSYQSEVGSGVGMTQTTEYPIFQRYLIEELYKKGCGGLVYLAQLKTGAKELTPTFKYKAASKLNSTVGELFGEEESAG